MGNRLWHVGLVILGMFAFVLVGFALEENVGIEFDTTYRLACAGLCLFVIYRFVADSFEALWPRVGLAIATAVNIGLLFTPLLRGPASRGEIMLFALPDAIVMLAARTVSYHAQDEHQRAVRQQLVLGLILAVASCSILFGLAALNPRVR